MKTAKKTGIGIIGCGNISGIYFKNLTQMEATRVVACSDLIPERSKAKAAEFAGVEACTNKQLLANPEVEIVVNLTTPPVHVEIALDALNAGKHTHSEKPMGISRKEGEAILRLARKKKLRIGCAPDTFMGGGIQTCRKLIDDGWIGTPIGATAFMMCHGHESWHPDPDFYYQPGGGPMFDMGPYYLTALINLMGPIRRVAGLTQTTFKKRLITSQPKFGTVINVNTPTHVTGLLDFACGAVGTIITTFDVWSAELPRIEVYGTEGTLSVPDPNTYGGPVRLHRRGESREIPLSHGYADNSRGVAVADMASAIRSGRDHRANGDLAFHVLDIMQALHESSATGRHVEMKTACERPAPMPMNLRPGAID